MASVWRSVGGFGFGALLLIGLAAPPALLSQDPTQIRVVVRAADTGRPLHGALVLVAGIGIRGTTDVRGVAELTALAPGSHVVEVRYLGYSAQTAAVRIEPARMTTAEFALVVEPIALAAVEVRARRSVLQNSGFFDRRGSGFGTFFTRQQIQAMRPRFMSDVLRRVAGVSLTPSAVGGRSRAGMRGTHSVGRCPIQYFIDGTPVAMYNIDEMGPDDVEGIEIYRGAATIPPAFNNGTALCGVVVIWTRVE